MEEIQRLLERALEQLDDPVPEPEDLWAVRDLIERASELLITEIRKMEEG